jgi:hypothetical protein
MDEVSSTIIHCKNFYKCHNVPPVQQFKKKRINNLEEIPLPDSEVETQHSRTHSIVKCKFHIKFIMIKCL